MIYTNGIYKSSKICMENQSVNIFRDKDGQNVVLINDIKFRTRRIVSCQKYISLYFKEQKGKQPVNNKLLCGSKLRIHRLRFSR